MIRVRPKVKNNTTLISLLWISSVITLLMHGKLPLMLNFSIISILASWILIIIDIGASGLSMLILKFLKLVWLYLIICLLYIVPAILSKYEYRIVLKESIYAIYILIVIFPLYYLKLKKIKIGKLSRVFAIGYIFLTVILTTVLYYNIIATGNWIGDILKIDSDYNYLSCAILTGSLCVIYLGRKTEKRGRIIILSFLLLYISLPVVFTGSRRGLVFFIVLNLFLLYYLIWHLFKGKNYRLALYYFYAMVFLGLASFILFATNSTAFRTYVIQKYQGSNAENFKENITKIAYRYSTILNKSPNYNKLYDKFWMPKPYSGNGRLNTIVFNAEKKKYEQFINTKDYFEAYERLKDLFYLSSSKEDFINLLVPEYRKFLKDTLLDKVSSIDNIPFRYPVPYAENDFIILNEINNLYLINNPDSCRNDLSFIPKRESYNNNASIVCPYLVFQNTENIIEINYKGIDPSNMNISFKDYEGNLHNFDFLKTQVVLEDNSNQLRISFKSNKLPSSMYWLILDFKMKNNDTITILASKYTRNPINTTSPNAININEFNHYLSLKKNKKYRSDRFHNTYLFESKHISTKETQTFIKFIKRINTFKPVFSEYGGHSIATLTSDSTYCFKVSNNTDYSRACAVLPAFDNGTYSVDLDIQSSKKPSAYIKRYPEGEPSFLDYQILKNEIHVDSGDIYKLNISYRILSSSSALGFLVVGIKYPREDDCFRILNADYTLHYLSDTTITKLQYMHLEPFLNKKLGINPPAKPGINDYGITDDNFLSSRLNRWFYAVEYFAAQNFYAKLFGDRFKYLEYYSATFKTKTDDEHEGDEYPHNPIISAFLYSGLIGGLIYLGFLGMIIYKYWRNRKGFALFAIIFFLTLAFTFFSGNSHFSVPSFTLLALIPFVD